MNEPSLMPNRPTPEGREAGAELARLAAPEIAAARAKNPAGTAPCASCAFVVGTHPNGCPQTVFDAIRAVATGDPFYCHHDLKDGLPTRVCAGWLACAVAREKAEPPSREDTT